MWDNYSWGSFSEESFSSSFGVTIAACQILHELVRSNRQPLPRHHLLMALFFLTAYPVDAVGASHFGVDISTYRESVWGSLVAICECVSLIDPRKRFTHQAPGNVYVSVDTTYCAVWMNVSDWEYQRPFYSGYAGLHCLKYEIAVQVWTGELVWLVGPFFGSKHDLTIARLSGFLNMLLPGEHAYADKLYEGDPRLLVPFKGRSWQLSHHQFVWNDFHRRVRVRCENAIGRIMRFGCLQAAWRHRLSRHAIAFYCCAQLAQLDLMLRPLRADFDREFA